MLQQLCDHVSTAEEGILNNSKDIGLMKQKLDHLEKQFLENKVHSWKVNLLVYGTVGNVEELEQVIRLIFKNMVSLVRASDILIRFEEKKWHRDFWNSTRTGPSHRLVCMNELPWTFLASFTWKVERIKWEEDKHMHISTSDMKGNSSQTHVKDAHNPKDQNTVC